MNIKKIDVLTGWNIQVSQVPESSEGIFGCSLYLITLNEPVEDKNKGMDLVINLWYCQHLITKSVIKIKSLCIRNMAGWKVIMPPIP